jgi:hypothetical protein
MPLHVGSAATVGGAVRRALSDWGLCSVAASWFWARLETIVESARLRVLGTIALVGIGCFIAIVLAMNVLSADLGLLDHTISGCALGDQGWLLTVAWFIDGAAVLALAAGLFASLSPGTRVRSSTWLVVRSPDRRTGSPVRCWVS